MADALIQIVDENDQPVGRASKDQMWREGLLHRVVRIMAFDKNGRVLLQKRAPTKIPFPGCWDNSVAGHVDAGEGYETAAGRELAEELGLHNIPLQEIGRYASNSRFEWRKMNRFVRVYRIGLDSLPSNFGRQEITEVRWFTREEIEDLITNHPEQTTDGLQEVWERKLI